MTQTADIRRRADGSIDTDHYMDRARHLRSVAMRTMASETGRELFRFFAAQLRRTRTLSTPPPGRSVSPR